MTRAYHPVCDSDEVSSNSIDSILNHSSDFFRAIKIMSTIAKLTKSTLDFYSWILKVLLTLLMLLMVLPVAIQILSRYTGIFPRYIWTEEVARFCFVWIVMIGSMIAVRDDSHFNVDLLPRSKTNRQKGVGNLIVHIAMMLMAFVFAWYGFGFAVFGFAQSSEMSGINMLSIYIAFPLAGLTWAVFLLEKIVGDVRLIFNREQELEL